MNPYIGDRQLDPDEEPDEEQLVRDMDADYLADPGEPNDYPENEE